MIVLGSGCTGGGSQATNQMTIWNPTTFKSQGLNVDFKYTQYPGYMGQSGASSTNGKAAQAKSAYEQTKKISTVINIGYSSGSESSLFTTELRQTQGLPTAALVIISPNYVDDTANSTIAVDYNNTPVTVNSFVQRIANVSIYTPVLIIDDTRKYQGLFDQYRKDNPGININVTINSNPYGILHISLDDSPWVVEETSNWLLSLGIK